MTYNRYREIEMRKKSKNSRISPYVEKKKILRDFGGKEPSTSVKGFLKFYLEFDSDKIKCKEAK